MTNFMKGFNEIVPQRCIQLFDPKEVEVTKQKKYKSTIMIIKIIIIYFFSN